MSNKTLYTFVLAVLVPVFSIAAGRIAEIWTQPAVFVPNEEVNIFFDVTGTDLADSEEDIFLWSWYPSEPDAGNGASSSDFAKLTRVEGNIWKITMIPTEYFGVEADKVDFIYGLLKNKDFSKATDAFAPDSDPPNHISVYSLATIKGDLIIDHFPKQIKADRPFSVLLNAANTWPDQCGENPVQGQLANAPNVHVHSGINNWSTVVENNPSNVNKTQLSNLGDNIYRWDFIPNEYFGVEKGTVIQNFNMVFASNDWSFIGKGENCSDFYIEVPAAPVTPEEKIPQLSFFPSKFSAKDIFCIIRKDNETNVNALNYNISADGKSINGKFEGSNSEFVAYINLTDVFNDGTSPEKIKVVITDNNGRKVLDSDIPLVQLND